MDPNRQIQVTQKIMGIIVADINATNLIAPKRQFEAKEKYTLAFLKCQYKMKILGLLVDYFICHGIPVNPALCAPRSGCGVDRHSMADIL